jgi:hypothetical protein
MVEDKIHFITMSIDTSNASAKSCHQVIHRSKQHSRQYGAFEMTPQSLYQVQTRTIWRQPVNFNLIPMCFKPSEYRLGLMETAVVADQSNFLAGICGYQHNQKHQKIQSTFGCGHGIRNLAGSVIYSAIHHLFFIFTWRWHFWLLTYQPPYPCQYWMEMNLRLILKDQSLFGIRLQCFFFKPMRSFLASRYAVSFLLPLSVCLGRWIEKPFSCRSLCN